MRPSGGRRSTSPPSPSARGCGASTAGIGVEYYTGYLVEKSLSVDNLFVFMLLLAAFAVPKALQQRVLLIGVVGALLLRGVFIALGAQMLELRLDVPALRPGSPRHRHQAAARRRAGRDHEIDISRMRSCACCGA